MKNNKIPKIKSTLTIKEKIAMIWTFPLMLIVFSILAIISISAYLLVLMFNLSGTNGASIYLFDQVKLKIIGMKLKKLIKEDEKLHKFETMINQKDENTASSAS